MFGVRGSHLPVQFLSMHFEGGSWVLKPMPTILNLKQVTNLCWIAGKGRGIRILHRSIETASSRRFLNQSKFVLSERALAEIRV